MSQLAKCFVSHLLQKFFIDNFWFFLIIQLRKVNQKDCVLSKTSPPRELSRHTYTFNEVAMVQDGTCGGPKGGTQHGRSNSKKGKKSAQHRMTCCFGHCSALEFYWLHRSWSAHIFRPKTNICLFFKKKCKEGLQKAKKSKKKQTKMKTGKNCKKKLRNAYFPPRSPVPHLVPDMQIFQRCGIDTGKGGDNDTACQQNNTIKGIQCK